MKTRPAGLVILVAVLLLGGLLLGRSFVAPAPASPADGGFRALLWDRRALDLAVQVGLIFGGVLGVLALLQEEGEK